MTAPMVWRVMLAALSLLSPFVVSDSGRAPVHDIPPTPPVRESCPHGYVALTFDDGPDAVTTPAITRALLAGGARGTFFFIGARAGALPDVVVLARSDGMEVGNHTYDHPFLDEMSADQVRGELTRTSEILDGLGGPAPHLFRAPYGRLSPVVDAVVRELGLTEVLWSYDSDDYAAATIDQMVKQVKEAKDGDVLLYHDGYQTTVAAIPLVLKELAARGLCAGRVVPTAERRQAWLDYDGSDKTYYHAKAVRW